MYQAVLNEITAHDTIILYRHSRPDGDAMGCQIGLKLLLQENFPGKTIYAPGDFSAVAGFEGVMPDEVPDEAFHGALAVILDCGAAHLISDGRWKTAARTVRLDHHIFTGRIADVEVVDTSFESCSGMVTELACCCNLRLTPAAAKALYSGMVADSGRFRFDYTTARTFRLAAVLMEQGLDLNDIYRDLYAQPIEEKKLTAQFVLKSKMTPNRVAYIYTTKEEVAQLQVDAFTVSRSMANILSDTRNTVIWVNFTESDSGVLCELRSCGPNINPIAVKYGGGGHAKASGAAVADRETAMQMLQELDKLAGDWQ